ncbi:AlpA family phage regulatory protein [Vibrio tarriae]|uniref:helix-turn-helix transcriptional regulator n=1 Tax=Vibrio tarriae TaxID=2014742 RepID=UPI000DE4C073|nr:helix-turn-helix domain-containing protein [Vibrio tarriae]EIY4765763.1 AlpA family phage regulatory protein [Vibrio cholerae]RBM67469.1 AlpA family phage regulatory protein [Vibrio tarriae]
MSKPQNNQQQVTTRLLTYSDLCEMLNRDRRTIWAWVKKDIFPSPIKSPTGVTIGWRPDDVQSWMDGSYTNA